MALIKCTECGKEVSDKAATCPNCGAPISAPAPGEAERQKVEVKVTQEKKKGSCLKTILIVIGAFFVIGIIGSLAGDDDKKEQENTEPVTAEVATGEEKEEDKESAEEKEEAQAEEVSNEFHVGDVLETKRVKLSYLSCGEYEDKNMFIEAGEGNKLVYLEFEFENIGDTDTSVGYFDFDCYADGYEAKASMCTADNAMSSITTLSPGRKTNGIVVFEIPQGAEKVEVEYETSYWTQDKAIFIYE